MICRFCFLRYFKFHPKASLSSALNVQVSDTTGDEENYGSSLHTLNLTSRNGNKIFDEFERGAKSNFHIEQETGAPDVFCIPVKAG